MIAPDRLAGLPALEGAPEAVLTALAAIATEVRFASGQTLFLEGSPARGWYVILEGRVRVVRGSGGRQHVIHTESRGGTLAEVPLFGGGPHPATAIAAEPTVCALFDRPGLERAITRHPAVAFLLLRRLALRVRRLVDRLDQRSARPVQARLAGFLLGLASTAPDGSVAVGMTQQELAEELGTVREVVARELRALRRDGLIAPRGRGHYLLRDREALGRVAGSG
jgi:CRP/FNR family transcriptional regulator